MNLSKDSIDAVLFDLDGTLMETDDHAVARLSVILARLRMSRPEIKARWVVMNAETPVNGLITLADRLGVDQLIAKVMGRNSSGKMISKKPHPIMEGAGEMLALLKPDFLLGLVTTNSQTEAEAFLAENNLSGMFDVVVSRFTTRRLKPHPEPILYAIHKLGLSPERCLMVGDTTPDMKAAIAAGVIPIGVQCGFGTRDELLKAGAHVVLNHTREVSRLLGVSGGRG